MIDAAPWSVTTVRRALLFLLGLTAFMWVLEGIDWVLRGALDAYAIIPRYVPGLRGIFFAPFLHYGFEHIGANTVPFLILGGLVLLRGLRTFVNVTVVVMLIGGIGVWLIGAPGFHLGASVLIFGYFGYLLLRGYFERRWPSIVLSVAVALVYGGLLLGVLPGQPGISWEGHLFGFVGGGLAANWFAQRPILRITERDLL